MNENVNKSDQFFNNINFKFFYSTYQRVLDVIQIIQKYLNNNQLFINTIKRINFFRLHPFMFLKLNAFFSSSSVHVFQVDSLLFIIIIKLKKSEIKFMYMNGRRLLLWWKRPHAGEFLNFIFNTRLDTKKISIHSIESRFRVFEEIWNFSRLWSCIMHL